MDEKAGASAAAPIRVLHLLVTMPVGGAEDLVAAIATGLPAERFEIRVACLGSPGPVGRELFQAGHRVVSLGLDVKHTSFMRLVAATRRLLKEQHPEILHTHLYHPNLYGRLAALGLGLKGVVAEVHNSYTTVKWHRRLWNCLLARVTDCLLVSGPQVWDDVRRYDGVPEAKLKLIPYGIRLEELQVPESQAEAKARLGVTGFCLGTVGRLEEQKGHEYLLAAVAALAPEIPDLALLLVGDGRRREFLQQQARELGVQDRVRFLGTRRDLPMIYRALDLYVQPSLWEGLPLSLLMAMGAGLPVVATQVSGAREVIEEGVNGRLVPPGDSPALTAALGELHRQPDLRRRLGQHAHETVAAHHSQAAMLRQLADLYLELHRKGSG
jgi:glycosyltransferase involved in cell wall biosynthesis